MRYIEGENRSQTTLFPEVIDDFIADDNPVRVIEAWVNRIDLQKLEFTHANTKATGRKPYNPQVLIKLYIYGYLNRIRTSRRLEAETHRNIELMWLLQKLKPDFKTIADFRKDNKKAIKLLVREFTIFCKSEGLFGLNLLCFDGSKFAAVNHSSKVHTITSLSEKIEELDKKIDSYLDSLDNNDNLEKDVKKETKNQIKKTLKKLKNKKKELVEYRHILKESGPPQIALTDQDCRMMRTRGKGRDMCYNVQLAVDSKYKLIAAFDVTNDFTDQHQLVPMTQKVKDEFQLDSFMAVADAGYYVKTQVQKVVKNNIDCYVAKQKNVPTKERQNLYQEKDFTYNQGGDYYLCPANQKMLPMHKTTKNGKPGLKYGTSSCKTCELRKKCTTSKNGRVIFRWIHEAIIENMNEKVKQHPEIMEERRNTAEHPFGTIKHSWGYRYFLCKGQEMTNTEMGLIIIAYNLRRTINIKGVPTLLASLA